jgi:hypothetical protein
MSFDQNFTGSGNNSSSTATAEHQNSLRAQVEAEKQAKIEELPEGLGEVDKALNELDGVITQVETSVGLHPSNPKRKKASHKKHTTHASVDQDWVIQKPRERRLSFNELTRLAKEENFKPASVKTVLTKLTEANLVRITDGEHYEIV